jgi:hypothetical protein
MDEPKKLTKEQHEALQKVVEEIFTEMIANMGKENNEPHMHAGGLIPSECDCCRERKRRKWREEFFAIINSPETRKRGEELHKSLSKMTTEDYMKVIT